MSGTLADQEFILFPDQGSHYVDGLPAGQNHGGDGGDHHLTLHSLQNIGSGVAAIHVDIPLSFGQMHDHIMGIGVKDHKQLLLIFLDAEGYYMVIAYGHGVHGFPDFIPGHAPQGRMGLAEGDQAPVVVYIVPVLLLVQVFPLDGIDLVGRTVAVFVKAALFSGLGPEHFFACLHEGDTLGQNGEGCRQIVHADQNLHGGIGGGQGKTVEEGIVVVAGYIVGWVLRTTGARP